MDAHSRRYEIRSTLGRGGFGTVYLANLVSSGGFEKQVALKMLHGQVDEVGEVAQRMRDEARMLGLLQHRAIVRVDGLVQLDGHWTVVMEYVEGVDLGRVVNEGGMPLAAALEVLVEVAAALQFAFEDPGPDGRPLQVQHRDIKPANIQITRKGEVKILDFGIARAEFASREAETQNLMFGTPGYMAPERFDMIDSHAGDVYSLGLVTYELLVGEPFGRALTNPERHAARVKVAMDRLHTAGIPDGVCRLLAEMITYDPDNRPTARQVAQRARDLLRQAEPPGLTEWTERHVRALIAAQKPQTHDLSGRVLTEGQARAEPTASFGAEDPRRDWTEDLPKLAATAGRFTLYGGTLFATLGAFGVAALLVVGLLVITVQRQQSAQSGATAATASAPTPKPAMKKRREDTGDVRPAADPSAPKVDPPGPLPGAPTAHPSQPGAASASTPAAPQTLTQGSPRPSAPEGAIAPGDCGELAALEGPARAGRLSAEQAACLQRAALTAERQVDRKAVGLVLLVHLQARCKASGDCAEYERFQRVYFEEVDRSDPELMYAFAVHLFKKQPRTDGLDAEVVAWARRALENKGQWKGVQFVQRVEHLHELNSRAAYARWARATEADADNNERLRVDARVAILEWLAYRKQLGKDATEPQRLCSSVTGGEPVCGASNASPTTPVVITFLSVPIGASVHVNGEVIGKAPLTHALAPGEHQVYLVAPDGKQSETRKVRVGPREPSRLSWSAGDGAWTLGP